jgi:hypothetical protein
MYTASVSDNIKQSLMKHKPIIGIGIAAVFVTLLFIPGGISDNALGKKDCSELGSTPAATGDPHTYTVCTGQPPGVPGNPHST